MIKNTIKKFFPFYEKEHGINYLDNANTTQILGSSLEMMDTIYKRCNFNLGRTSYQGAKVAQQVRDESAAIIADFIGATPDNIIFTSGATEGLNYIADSFCNYYASEGRKGVLLTTELEHASAILPWIMFGKNIFEIKYIKLEEDYNLTEDNIKAAFIEHQPNVLLLSSMTNTTGEKRDLKLIGSIAKHFGVPFIVDHAQGAAHMSIDVREQNIDFLAFSGHKMYGPKGIGVLYARNLDTLKMQRFGGGMNKTYGLSEQGTFFLPQDGVERFQAGSENFPAICGLSTATEFIKDNIKDITNHEIFLSKLCLTLLERIKGVRIHSTKEWDTSIVLFTIDDYEASDIMDFLDKREIYIRAGNHCSKLTGNLFGLSTCRISVGAYNTEDEIIALYKALVEMLGGEKKCLKEEYVQELKNAK